MDDDSGQSKKSIPERVNPSGGITGTSQYFKGVFFMKKFFSLILAIVLFMNCFPMSGFAYTCSDYNQCTANGAEIYEVAKDDTPIRRESHNGGQIVAYAQKGQLISVKRTFTTLKLAKWAEIQLGDGSSLYVYYGNIQRHQHDFVTLAKNGVGSVASFRLG